MQDTKKIIETFYSAFQQKDWRAMQTCYHDEVLFTDPVFRNLKGPKAKAMWHMLAIAAKDLTLTFQNIDADGSKGSCDWDAHYSFSRTGRKVHNIIHARFEFSEGKIIKHTDSFNLWKWAGMALGFSGTLLGWTPLIQSKIRSNAEKGLKKFIQEHPEYNA